METDHEKAQSACNYRRCRITDWAPFALQWSQKSVSLSVDSAEARIGALQASTEGQPVCVSRHRPRSPATALVCRYAAPDRRMAGAADGGGFSWDTAPSYLVRDNDGAYGQTFKDRVRAMGIRDRPISPRSPWQNPYVERLIGTLRRDCLDHVLIFGERHLRWVLTSYSVYYNETRTHLGLGKDAPLGRDVERSGTVAAIPVLCGLHHRYARI